MQCINLCNRNKRIYKACTEQRISLAGCFCLFDEVTANIFLLALFFSLFTFSSYYTFLFLLLYYSFISPLYCTSSYTLLVHILLYCTSLTYCINFKHSKFTSDIVEFPRIASFYVWMNYWATFQFLIANRWTNSVCNTAIENIFIALHTDIRLYILASMLSMKKSVMNA